MTFGTPGLSSAIGAGLCYINDLTAGPSTQRMHTYLEGSCSDFMQSSFAWVCHARSRNQQLWQPEIGRLPAAGLLAGYGSLVPFLKPTSYTFCIFCSWELKAGTGVGHGLSRERQDTRFIWKLEFRSHLMIKEFQEAEKVVWWPGWFLE